MDNLSVHEQESKVVSVTYHKNQPLEIIISPDHRSFIATVLFDEELEGDDMVQRPRIAREIYLDQIPVEFVEMSKTIILGYLKNSHIVIDSRTKYIV